MTPEESKMREASWRHHRASTNLKEANRVLHEAEVENRLASEAFEAAEKSWMESRGPCLGGQNFPASGDGCVKVKVDGNPARTVMPATPGSGEVKP